MKRPATTLGLAAALLVLPAAAALAQAAPAPAPPPEGERSLVLTVMPFKTIADSAYAYLGESFSEALSTKLVGLRRVRLYERSQFDKLAGELRLEKDAAGMFDASTLARAGAVVSIDYALLGSVTQSGSTLTCNVRLVHVTTGKIALAREFRGAFPGELFPLQDAAAVAVAQALSISLGELELKRLSARPTSDADAYGLYNRSLGSGDKAERVRLLEQATARDPSFVMAWHLLADAYLALGRPERAEAALGRIIAIDPSDYRAAYNLALLRLDEADYSGARSLLMACLELKAGDADALYHVGLSYEFPPDGGPGRERYGPGSDVPAALGYYRRAMAADPRHAEARLAGGTLAGILAQAEPDVRKRLELLREAASGIAGYLELEPDADDADMLGYTLEALAAAIKEHEDYLGQTP